MKTIAEQIQTLCSREKRYANDPLDYIYNNPTRHWLEYIVGGSNNYRVLIFEDNSYLQQRYADKAEPILVTGNLSDTLAATFKESLNGKTNIEISDYLDDEPTDYTQPKHSGHEFEPMKFYFPDGSMLNIHDWIDELSLPRFEVWFGDAPQQQPAESIKATQKELRQEWLNVFGTITVESKPQQKVDIDVHVAHFDNVTWSGEVQFIMAGTTAVVTHYMAETMMEVDANEGKLVASRAVVIAVLDAPEVFPKGVNAVLFSSELSTLNSIQ